MKTKKVLRNGLAILLLLAGNLALAQTTLNGTVVDAANNEAIPGANIVIQGTSEGVATDFDGKFSLTTEQNPPFTIEVSSIGFGTKVLEISASDQNMNISLEAGEALDEIVIAASRRPERIAESPVSIERLGLNDIKYSTSSDFYSSVENLKGVDVLYSSITLPIVNTRGFASFSNERFLQLVDGMDSAAPGIQFPIGNLIGLNQLDVASVELLPGASSALYGANAFNGILLMNSKSPFDDPGISAYVKSGITSSSNNGDNTYYDVGIRAAFKLSDKFAVKFNFSHYEGKDWAQTDERMYVDAGPGTPDRLVTRTGNELAFDALSRYGDEITQDLDFQEIALANPQVRGLVAQGIAAAMGLPSADLVPGSAIDGQIAQALPAGETTIGMDGYAEKDLWDYDASNTKFDASLHYRLSDDVELSWVSKIASGNTIYQGASRYILKNFGIQQHKLELRGDNFFVRGYTTIEDTGDTYDAVYTGQFINISQGQEWFTTYAGTYIQSVLTGNPSHSAARTAANATLAQVGTPEFQQLYNSITQTPLYNGSQFNDQTSLTHVDANYNFGDLGKLGELQVGGSYRNYELNSNGTIFTDNDGPISVYEYGVYTQLQSQISDQIKFTGSIRYDGAQNFDANFSPRLSLVISPDKAKVHNFRLSYQTGFRYPTNQDQYIGLETPVGILLGSAKDNFDRYETTSRGTSAELGAQAVGLLNQLGVDIYDTLTGNDILSNSYSLSSALQFSATQNPQLLQKAQVNPVQPEKVVAYEVGYRGRVGKVYIDASYYRNDYDNFIASQIVATPHVGDVAGTQIIPAAFSPIGADLPASVLALAEGLFTVVAIDSNTDADVKSSGFNIGLDTSFDDFNVGISYTNATLDFDQTANPDFETGFNTPENTFKVSLSNNNLFKNFGFGINYKYLESFLWESSYFDGIVPERNLLDAQINLTIKDFNVKLGGTNLFGDEYYAAPGAGLVGSTYYIGLRYGF